MAFSIKDWFKGTFKLGGTAISIMEVPPGWSYDSYLSAYGEVGWLFAANNIISENVADVKWDLYNKDNGRKGDIVEAHPLIDMLAYVNPFQTKYQFIQLLQLYIGLVGEAFIVLNYNKLGVPAEMWLAPPQNMTVVPSSKTYIDHYIYKKGNDRLRLEVPEVIHIMNPNPASLYRGIGTAQTIGVDLDSEKNAVRYQNRLFYNDATPGMLIEYPEIPEKTERDKIRKEWNEIHQGWRNARKTGFLWGGAKANTLALTNKDMEYWQLRKINRETIIGAYRIPTSMLGLEGPGSRARVEADELVFAKYVLKPALTRIKESLNEQLVPLYDDGFMLDFEDVVPQNREAVVSEVKELYPLGVYTLQESRLLLGVNADPEPGETFVQTHAPDALKRKSGRVLAPSKGKALTEEQKEQRWKVMADHAEENERLYKKLFKRLWFEQMNEVVELYALTQDTLDEEAAANSWSERFLPLYTEIYEGSFDLTAEGGELSPAHRHAEKQLSPWALEWLATRSLSVAQMVNGTTKKELRKALVEGFEAGESAQQLTKRIKKYYRNGYEKRAAMVARTEVIAASNEGAIQGYEKAGLQKVDFYPSPDACEECGEIMLDNPFPLDQAHGLIPVHPNCRCTWLPLVD